MDFFFKGISREIKETRLAKDMGVAELGNMADMDVSHIYSLESNRRHVGLVSLVKIAKGLGVSVDDLLPVDTESAEMKKIKAILNSCDSTQLGEINRYLDEKYGKDRRGR